MTAPWTEGPKHTKWSKPEISLKILGEHEEGRGMPIPADWARISAQRLRKLRDELRSSWVGLDIPEFNSHRIDWLLACLIARENVLLLGPPGVAKTEIAERTYKLLGLTSPEAELDIPAPDVSGGFQKWWDKRTRDEKQNQKYFRYLLSRFTQPEELFGPIEISLLRQGILCHINFGLLTGPGVRAAFLDEVFKASSSILNSLLTLTQEREYFNRGGMVKSDLIMFIGASNELPGGLATGSYGVGSGGEDFNLLYAFLDRFPIRIEVPSLSGQNKAGSVRESDLAKAAEKAIDRESLRFVSSHGFREPSWGADSPSINDVLLLGRCCLERDALKKSGIFSEKKLFDFQNAFFGICAALQQQNTEAGINRITWTISPRKIKALYKIALAHALICDDGFAGDAQLVDGPSENDLHVFDFIWDSPTCRDDLSQQILRHIDYYWGISKSGRK